MLEWNVGQRRLLVGHAGLWEMLSSVMGRYRKKYASLFSLLPGFFKTAVSPAPTFFGFSNAPETRNWMMPTIGRGYNRRILSLPMWN
jgi:hypothetical protein